MGWKDWPYWVRGGIIGLILDILVWLLVPSACSDFYRIGPAYPTNQPFCYWLVVNGKWVEASIIIFILGVLLGWIYSKTKIK